MLVYINTQRELEVDPMKIDISGYDYDEEVDIITISITNQKSDFTVELGEHFLIDMTNNDELVSIEILDASKELSKIFGRLVPKDEMKLLLCNLNEEPKSEYLLHFQTQERKESANLLILPIYKSPIVN